jgi:ABC-type Na+ efflux pump permease subunit
MSWKTVKAFIIKTLKLRFRDRGDMFWVFAWPIILIMLSATLFIPPNINKPITLGVGVVNRDISSKASFNGTLLVNIMNNASIDNVKLFRVRLYNDTSNMINDIERGKLDAGLYIPNGFGENTTFSQGKLILYVYSGNTQKRQIIYGIFSEFFQRLNYEVSIRKIDYMVSYIPYENISTGYNITPRLIKRYFIGIAAPINISYNDITPKSINTREKILGWYTIGDVGMLMLYTGLWLGAVMVVEEKDMKTLKRILSTPSTPSDMLVGKTLAGLIILGLS